ncbi:hypothetical protein PK28_13300 [Hymenobacter sp. DG25B]|nr:hypothetical protein PK28_13300 [Hymenobacter sp. DG25B]
MPRYHGKGGAVPIGTQAQQYIYGSQAGANQQHGIVQTNSAQGALRPGVAMKTGMGAVALGRAGRGQGREIT